jgi:hypothetical protein
MDGEQQLFEGAVEACVIQAHFVLGEGWSLRLQLRRQFEDWAAARTETYERLSTDELVEVLDVSLVTFRASLGY